MVTEIEALKGQPGKEPKGINWADVSKKHCKDLYQLLYRSLSADGVHTTIDALNRHVEADANMQITGLKGGPDFEGLIDTLGAACLTFLWAAEPFVRAFDRNDIQARVQEQIRRFRLLPDAEPNSTAV